MTTNQLFCLAHYVAPKCWGGGQYTVSQVSPSYGAPEPSYSAPSPSYGAPSTGYDEPSSGYGQPSYEEEGGGLDLTALLIPILALIGLSLLFPTYVSVATGRKKRSLPDGTEVVGEFISES